MKKKHYQLTWDILKAVDVVKEYERIHGAVQLTYPWLCKIYKGNLLEAAHFNRIPKRNMYGVTFKTRIQLENGQQVLDHTSFKLDTPVTLTELIDGIKDAKVRDKTGIITKGWKGASKEWIALMDNQWSDYECLEAHAVVNCLV